MDLLCGSAMPRAFAHPTRLSSLLRQLRDVISGNPPERRGAADAMLAETAGGIAASIKAGDRPAAQVNDLRARIDAQSRIGVVDRRRMPGRVDRRLGDLVHGRRLLEVLIDRGVDEQVVSIDRFAQPLWR